MIDMDVVDNDPMDTDTKESAGKCSKTPFYIEFILSMYLFQQ